jgi:TPR repeat protein
LRERWLGAVKPTAIADAKGRAILQQAIGYYTGTQGKIDIQQARTLFEQAADTQDVIAKMWLARCYMGGRAGFQQDVEAGQVLASPIIQQVESLAQLGDKEAAFLMGSAYHEGIAVQPNVQQAIVWYHKAADQGHIIAQHTLGAIYLSGQEVAQSIKNAVLWLRKAAEQGDATAQFSLGFVYERGIGIPPNQQAALHWYGKAAERGHEDAQRRTQALNQ